MKLIITITLFIITSFLIACEHQINNCSKILEKVITTATFNEMSGISIDSLKSKCLCSNLRRIEANLKKDSTFFGYFIVNRYNENCSSDSLKSWRFKAYYKDSIYSKNEFEVYEGDLIYSNIQGPSDNFTLNNYFTSSYNYVCVKQIIDEDFFEIYYFFKFKKATIKHNRIRAFGLNR